MHRNLSLNNMTINLYDLTLEMCRLKYLNDRKDKKFLPYRLNLSSKRLIYSTNSICQSLSLLRFHYADFSETAGDMNSPEL